MRLLVDVGNTNVKLAVADGERLVTAGAIASGDRAASASTLESLIADRLEAAGADPERIEAVALASVVPAWTQLLRTWAERRRLRMYVASPGSIPMPVRTDHPGEVGVDRLLNALAVARLHGVPAIAVDLGTATTFDVVDGDGAFAGGAIAPGLRLGLEALATRTAGLPLVEPSLPLRAIGTNTVDAVRSGGVLGHAAMVGGMLAGIRAELGEKYGAGPVHVVITGGLASLDWAALIPGVDAVDPELTLKGLAMAESEAAAVTS